MLILVSASAFSSAYEIPYVVQTSSGGPRESGWSNASTGVKWRFLDQGGWQVSTFPQLQTAASAAAQRTGIAVEGPRLATTGAR
jgi:hypothetical protein